MTLAGDSKPQRPAGAARCELGYAFPYAFGLPSQWLYYFEDIAAMLNCSEKGALGCITKGSAPGN